MHMLTTTTVLVLTLLGSSGTTLPDSVDLDHVMQAQEPGQGKKKEGEKKEGEKKEKEKEKEGKTAAAEGAWLTDHKTALAAAKKAKKPVLMVFTGSDWCPPCKKLHHDVFESEAFKAWAPKNVVLLELDFPRKKELPKEQKQHNDKLKNEFKVTGFPTVIALDAKGKKLHEQSGFGGGSAEDWIKKFEKEIGKK